uniref:Delta(14)-sterol reductase TM7SF2 n=1 Tax=Callorhinchus milii TaxID=7868 RepID=A0A4W3KF28_CALMI
MAWIWGRKNSCGLNKTPRKSGHSAPPAYTLCLTDLIFLSFFLPVYVCYILIMCQAVDDRKMPSFSELWDIKSFLILIGFILFQAGLYLLPIGKVHSNNNNNNPKFGHSIRDCLWDAAVRNWLLHFAHKIRRLWLAGLTGAEWEDSLPTVRGAVSNATIIITFILSYYYSGNFLQELMLGREINPKFGKLPIKFFFMVRIGYLGWVTLKMNEKPPLAFSLVVLFQLVYVVDTLIDEETILITKEITKESIGFLMVFGEIVWIPFTSSLPVNYLYYNSQELSYLQVTAISTLFGKTVGFFIYLKSNQQKNNFRKDPHDKAFAHLKTINTTSGKKLLVSGWWGWLRHPNYLGDILCYLSWTLPCGFCHIIVYFNMVLVFRLLMERAEEIEEDCHQRYGQAWEEYCRRIQYKFIPHVY